MVRWGELSAVLLVVASACAQATEGDSSAGGADATGGAGGDACAVDESCNGVDDNCNGEVDEGCECVVDTDQSCYSGRAGTEGIGACVAGSQHCYDFGWGECKLEVTPEAESCNGVDDDCDEQIDEDDPDGGGDCLTGLPGICEMGTWHCVDGSAACVQNAMAEVEVCNLIDDDCDGTYDNGNPGGDLPCDTGVPGLCAAGSTYCFGGQVICTQPVNPASEICNGEDDDCDGVVDNGDPGGGGACATGLLGECSAGVNSCQGGAIVCNQTNMTSAEVCGNNLDENCNGVADDGCAVCGGNTADCDLSPLNGCECESPTQSCCGTFCETKHANGVGQFYYDCSPLQSYGPAAANQACAAYTGSNSLCTPYNCNGPGANQVVCSDGAGNCICWVYTGTLTGYLYDDITSGCFCPAVPGVSWQ